MSSCDCHDRAHDGTFPLLLMHFQDCPHFGPHLRELIEGLVRGMEEWAADEDGIHKEAWGAYQHAKIALGEPVKNAAA